jgi:hypothetical protein
LSRCKIKKYSEGNAMKSEKEQHGKETNSFRTLNGYAKFFEPIPFRPTFSEREKSSSLVRTPGWDRSWEDAAAKVTPQGDGRPGPRTPVSGGEDADTPRAVRRTKPHSAVDKFLGGKNYDAPKGRVPDAHQYWKNTGPQGSGEMFPNEGMQSKATRRPIQLGWQKRYSVVTAPDYTAAAPMTVQDSSVTSTPQRKKLRKGESRPSKP